jgi:hypothetical protein
MGQAKTSKTLGELDPYRVGKASSYPLKPEKKKNKNERPCLQNNIQGHSLKHE